MTVEKRELTVESFVADHPELKAAIENIENELRKELGSGTEIKQSLALEESEPYLRLIVRPEKYSSTTMSAICRIRNAAIPDSMQMLLHVFTDFRRAGFGSA